MGTIFGICVGCEKIEVKGEITKLMLRFVLITIKMIEKIEIKHIKIDRMVKPKYFVNLFEVKL